LRENAGRNATQRGNICCREDQITFRRGLPTAGSVRMVKNGGPPRLPFAASPGNHRIGYVRVAGVSHERHQCPASPRPLRPPLRDASRGYLATAPSANARASSWHVLRGDLGEAAASAGDAAAGRKNQRARPRKGRLFSCVGGTISREWDIEESAFKTRGRIMSGVTYSKTMCAPAF